MSLAIRRASLAEDRQRMLDLFQRNFGDNHEQRFEWRWMLNPAGVGWTWFVYERGADRVAGTTSLFPRQFYVNGKAVRAGQVMFFAVDEGYRSLGPAVMLQRATFEPVDTGQLSFCYDCPPHDEGMSTFDRIGMRANCEMARYALLLRSDEYLEKRLGTGFWTKPLASAANVILGMRTAKPPVPGLQISAFDGRFGDEFSHLDKLVPTSGVIRASRSAEMLNWRLRDDPYQPLASHGGTIGRYRTLVARRAEELVAFLVFLQETKSRVLIVDLFGTHLLEAAAPLLEATITICRQENAECLYAYCVPDSELSRVLEGSGFKRRERTARVVAYEKPDGRGEGRLGPGLQWAFSQIELDL